MRTAILEETTSGKMKRFYFKDCKVKFENGIIANAEMSRTDDSVWQIPYPVAIAMSKRYGAKIEQIIE